MSRELASLEAAVEEIRTLDWDSVATGEAILTAKAALPPPIDVNICAQHAEDIVSELAALRVALVQADATLLEERRQRAHDAQLHREALAAGQRELQAVRAGAAAAVAATEKELLVVRVAAEKERRKAAAELAAARASALSEVASTADAEAAAQKEAEAPNGVDDLHRVEALEGAGAGDVAIGDAEQVVEAAAEMTETSAESGAGAAVEAVKGMAQAAEAVVEAATETTGVVSTGTFVDQSQQTDVDESQQAALDVLRAQVEALESQLATVRWQAATTSQEQEIEIEQLKRSLQEATHAVSAPPAELLSEEATARRNALEAAADDLERERAAMQLAATEAARREERRLEAHELMARELAELQTLLSGQQPLGAALVRLGREKTEMLEQLAPTQRRVAELAEDVEALQRECKLLRARNAELRRRQANA